MAGDPITKALAAILRPAGIPVPSLAALTGDPPAMRLPLPAEGASPIDLRALVAAAGLDGLTDALPKELAVGESLVLSALEASFDGGSVAAARVALGWPKDSWEVIPGLVLAAPTAQIGKLGASLDLAFSGVLKGAGLALSATVNWTHRFVGGSLAPGANIALGPLLDHFQLGVHGFEDARLATLEFEGDLMAQRTLFAVEVLDAWKVQNLAVTDVSLRVEHLPGAYGGWDVALQGVLEIEIEEPSKTTLTLLLDASHSGPNTGWLLSGSLELPAPGVSIGEMVGKLAGKVGVVLPSSRLPAPVQDLFLDGFTFSLQTRSRDFRAECHGHLELDDGKHPLGLSAHVDLVRQEIAPNPATWAFGFGGALRLRVGDHPMELEIAYQEDKHAQVFGAQWKDTAGLEIKLGELVAATGAPLDSGTKNLLDGFEFTLHSVAVAIEKASAATGDQKKATGLLVTTDFDLGFDLSHLPLVGKRLKKGAWLRLVVQPVYVSKKFPHQSVDESKPDLLAAQAALRDAVPAHIGEPGYGLTLATRLHVAGSTYEMQGFRIGPSSPGGDLQALGDGPPAHGVTVADGPLTAGSGVPAQPADDGIHWVPIGRTLGPVSVQQVGFKLDKDSHALDVRIDGSFQLAGFQLDLMGLGADYDLKSKHLSFHLDGLGLKFERGPLVIGGAFMRMQVKVGGVTIDEYVGEVTLRAGPIGLSAIGMYAEVEGRASIFLYGVLLAPLGGPPFLFIEGVAAGFGYNRAFVPPPLAKVGEFPLITQAMGTLPAPDPNGPPAAGLGEELRLLGPAIPIELDEYFLAVGVKASTFKLVDTFLLLIVSFGKHLRFDLIGLCRAAVPAEAPQPLALLELAIEGRLDPEAGYFELRGQLTRKSFLLEPACHLTGGFAVEAFWKDQQSGARAGDFLLTIGGYHPDFERPEWYPRVPRLGYDWRVTSEVEIRGGMYFALVPHMLMAGGSFNATWHSGGLKAWFCLGADFLIQWQPYHYDARAHIEIGASYHTFLGDVSGSIGAGVHIWGPSFAGRASFHFGPFGFDVDFGDGSKAPPPISWDDFKAAFLPGADGVVSASVDSGLLKTVTDKDVAGTKRLIVNPKEFVLRTDTAVPVAKATVAGTEVTATAEYAGAAQSPPVPRDDFGVSPCEIEKVASSEHAVRVEQVERPAGGQEQRVAVDARFDVERRPKWFPAALWGSRGGDGESAARVASPDGEPVIALYGGLVVRPKDPVAPGATSWIQRSVLDYDVELFRVTRADDWDDFKRGLDGRLMARDQPALVGYGDVPLRDDAGRRADRETLAETVDTAATRDARARVAAGLGVAAPIHPHADLAHAFTVAPHLLSP